MSDNVNIKDFSGSSVAVATDQVTDGTLGTVQVQYMKLMDGTLDSTNKLVINSSGEASTTNLSLGSSSGGTAGTKSALSGGLYLSSLPSLSNGQQSSLILDSSGVLQIGYKNTELAARATASWSSATATNTTVSSEMAGMGNCTFTAVITGTVTGGVIAFEVSPDGTNWLPLGVVNSTTIPSMITTYNLSGGTASWQMFAGGYSNARIRLTSSIVGTGSVSLIVQPSTSATEFVTQSYIYGRTTGGGGAVAVKVTPSGALNAVVTAADGDVYVRSTSAANFNATVVGTGTFAVQAAQSGTWNIGSVSSLPSLVAGSAIIGKVGIDQTTPGSTNLVATNADGTIGAGTAPSKSIVTGGVFNTTQPTLTTGQGAAMQLSSRGAQIVATGADTFNVVVTSAPTTAVTGTFWQATQPVSLTTLPSLAAGSALIGKVGIDQTTPGTTNAVSLANIGTATVATGNGVAGAGVQRVTIASDNTAFNVNALQSGTWTVTGAGGTFPVTDSGGSLTVDNAGTFAVQAAQSGTWTVTGAGGTFPVTDSGGSLTVDNAGTFAVQAAQSGTWTVGTNSESSIGAGTAPSKAQVIAGVYNSTLPSPTTGQSVAIQLDAKGNQRHVIMDAAGNLRGANVDASNRLSVTVDNVSATNISTNIAQIGAGTVATGNGASGTGVLRVTVASDSTGTLAVTQSTASNLNAQVVGSIASGSPASSNPVLVGSRAATANPTKVTNGQAVNTMSDAVGRRVVVQGAPRELVSARATTITSSTSPVTCVTAAGSGVFTDITSLTVTNGSVTATTVTLSDGTSSFVYNCSGGGGITIPFNPPLPATTANTAWTLTCGTSVASVYCNIVYIKNV